MEDRECRPTRSAAWPSSSVAAIRAAMLADGAPGMLYRADGVDGPQEMEKN